MLTIEKEVSGTLDLVSSISSMRVDIGFNGQRKFLIQVDS